MSKIKKIIVGLPARNEESAITKCLESVRESILYSGRSNTTLVVCLNGCTDKTPALVETFQERYQDIRCEVIQSNEGLVNAQREIVKKYPADVYVFSDSDSTIDQRSIELLLSNLEKHSEVVVAYAKTAPLEKLDNKSIFYKLGLLYDSQKMLRPRHYFHGRLFATRDWFLPPNEEILKRAMKNDYTRELLKYSEKDILLYADDVFMSSYILDRYGRGAILQVEDARCYSWPVGSFHDWLNTYRRRNIEMEKMYRWFPEYNYLWPWLNRRTGWRNWLKASLTNKILWLAFMMMRGGLYLHVRAELLLIMFKWFRPKGQWQVTTTTKK